MQSFSLEVQHFSANSRFYHIATKLEKAEFFEYAERVNQGVWRSLDEKTN